MRGSVDLPTLISRLADRDAVRTEANVQSDLHAFLIAAPLNLIDHQLHDIILELAERLTRRWPLSW